MGNRTTTDNLWALVFIGPQVIGLVAFSAIPLLSAMYLSLTNWDGFGNQTFVGLDNFVEQIQSPDLHIALWNTLVYTLIAVPGGLILALLVALGLSNIRVQDVLPAAVLHAGGDQLGGGVRCLAVLAEQRLRDHQHLCQGVVRCGSAELADRQRWVMPTIAVIGIWQGLGYSMVIFLAGLAECPGVVHGSRADRRRQQVPDLPQRDAAAAVADDLLPDASPR